jgi:hypothetical protein
MSGRTIKAGSANQYCEIKVFTAATGAAKTDLVYNTSGLAIWYQIGNAAAVEVVVGGSPAPATMAAGGAHADWGIYHVAQGRYKIGLADAVVSAAANVTVWIVYTECDSVPCEIDVVGYDKTAAAVGANTVAPATPANVTTSTSTITALLPAALVGGRMDASVGAMAANTLTASAVAADAGAEIAALVETYIVNEGDATATMQALADKIAADWVAGDASPLAVATAVWSAATRSLTDKSGFALSATGLDLVTTWTTDITGSLSGNVGGIAGTINTLDELDTAQDTQHGTTQDRLGYTLAALAGACADAGTAAETYAITIGVDTYTIDHTGLDATGNRGTATLTKS